MDNNTLYLYGASVQGIQNFIFKTNQIKDIVGASELVENICSTAFDEYGKNYGRPLVRAAGNIKHIFDREEDCRKAVLEFPKKVMTMAPGITISQAVVKIDGNTIFEQAIEELEKRLRIQRNKPSKDLNFCFSGVLRSRKTGLPVVKVDDGDFIDIGTEKKREQISHAKYNLCKKFFGSDINNKNYAYDIKDITEDNDWIAVIHADGNGLGQVLPKIGKSEQSLSEFSNTLRISTQNAAYKAYKKIIPLDDGMTKAIPFRPIILGGDDLTIICKGNLAIPFTKYFLHYFEQETGKNLKAILKSSNCGFSHLTACAGISFIKSSFPFYYGYDLAETLCSEAKNIAKDPSNMINGLAPSCLMFHKVQDSFVESYDEIVNRELTLDNGGTLKFGPYYLSENMDNQWSIDKLIESVKLLESENGNALKSGLRQWLSLAYQSMEKAKQKESRLKKIVHPDFIHNLTDYTNREDKRYPIYDILCLYTINNQKTNL